MTDRSYTLRTIAQTEIGTFGALMDGDRQICVTCERPWLNNQSGVSCIPAGSYIFDRYESPTKGPVWLARNVPGRSMIEIHAANYPRELKGCIATGQGFMRKPDMTIYGVTSSRPTMAKLLTELPDSFTLVVERLSEA